MVTKAEAWTQPIPPAQLPSYIETDLAPNIEQQQYYLKAQQAAQQAAESAGKEFREWQEAAKWAAKPFPTQYYPEEIRSKVAYIRKIQRESEKANVLAAARYAKERADILAQAIKEKKTIGQIKAMGFSIEEIGAAGKILEEMPAAKPKVPTSWEILGKTMGYTQAQIAGGYARMREAEIKAAKEAGVTPAPTAPTTGVKVMKQQLQVAAAGGLGVPSLPGAIQTIPQLEQKIFQGQTIGQLRAAGYSLEQIGQTARKIEDFQTTITTQSPETALNQLRQKGYSDQDILRYSQMAAATEAARPTIEVIKAIDVAAAEAAAKYGKPAVTDKGYIDVMVTPVTPSVLQTIGAEISRISRPLQPVEQIKVVGKEVKTAFGTFFGGRPLLPVTITPEEQAQISYPIQVEKRLIGKWPAPLQWTAGLPVKAVTGIASLTAAGIIGGKAYEREIGKRTELEKISAVQAKAAENLNKLQGIVNQLTSEANIQNEALTKDINALNAQTQNLQYRIERKETIPKQEYQAYLNLYEDIKTRVKAQEERTTEIEKIQKKMQEVYSNYASLEKQRFEMERELKVTEAAKVYLPTSPLAVVPFSGEIQRTMKIAQEYAVPKRWKAFGKGMELTGKEIVLGTTLREPKRFKEQALMLPFYAAEQAATRPFEIGLKTMEYLTLGQVFRGATEAIQRIPAAGRAFQWLKTPSPTVMQYGKRLKEYQLATGRYFPPLVVVGKGVASGAVPTAREFGAALLVTPGKAILRGILTSPKVISTIYGIGILGGATKIAAEEKVPYSKALAGLLVTEALPMEITIAAAKLTEPVVRQRPLEPAKRGVVMMEYKEVPVETSPEILKGLRQKGKALGMPQKIEIILTPRIRYGTSRDFVGTKGGIRTSGFYDPKMDEIVIRKGLSQKDIVKTLKHELAHYYRTKTGAPSVKFYDTEAGKAIEETAARLAETGRPILLSIKQTISPKTMKGPIVIKQYAEYRQPGQVTEVWGTRLGKALGQKPKVYVAPEIVIKRETLPTVPKRATIDGQDIQYYITKMYERKEGVTGARKVTEYVIVGIGEGGKTSQFLATATSRQKEMLAKIIAKQLDIPKASIKVALDRTQLNIGLEYTKKLYPLDYRYGGVKLTDKGVYIKSIGRVIGKEEFLQAMSADSTISRGGTFTMPVREATLSKGGKAISAWKNIDTAKALNKMDFKFQVEKIEQGVTYETVKKVPKEITYIGKRFEPKKVTEGELIKVKVETAKGRIAIGKPKWKVGEGATLKEFTLFPVEKRVGAKIDTVPSRIIVYSPAEAEEKIITFKGKMPASRPSKPIYPPAPTKPPAPTTAPSADVITKTITGTKIITGILPKVTVEPSPIEKVIVVKEVAKAVKTGAATDIGLAVGAEVELTKGLIGQEQLKKLNVIEQQKLLGIQKISELAKVQAKAVTTEKVTEDYKYGGKALSALLTIPIERVEEKEKVEEKVIPKTEVIPRVLPSLVTPVKVTPVKVIIPTEPIVPPPEVPIVPMLMFGKRKPERRRRETFIGYQALVRRRKKFYPISPITTKRAALDIGAREVGQTLAATFVVKPVRGIKPKEIKTYGEFQKMLPKLRAYALRRGRPVALPNLTFIEKDPFRLKKGGPEVKEIISVRRARGLR